MSADLVGLLPVFGEANGVASKGVDGSCSGFVEVEFGAEVCKCAVLCCPCHCVVVNGFEFGDELVAEFVVPCFDVGCVGVRCVECSVELVGGEVELLSCHCFGAVFYELPSRLRVDYWLFV